MDGLPIAALIALVTAAAGGIAAAVKAVLDRRTGKAGNEVERRKAESADWSAFTQAQRSELQRLTERVERLERLRQNDLDYIAILRAHIAGGYGPPPPERPQHA